MNTNMQSSFEKKLLSQGKSIIDQKTDELIKVNYEVNSPIKKAKVIKEANIPDVIQQEFSSVALSSIDEIHHRQTQKLQKGLP